MGTSFFNWISAWAANLVTCSETAYLPESQNCILEVQLKCQHRGKLQKGWVHAQDAVCLLSKRLFSGTASPVGRIYEFGNQGVKAAVVPLTITPNNALGIFPVPLTLNSA